MVRMRLWSLFCGGNKTSDDPQLTNNYLCSKALQQEQQSSGSEMKAPHSMWKHKAKGESVHRSGWPVKNCVLEDNFCHCI